MCEIAIRKDNGVKVRFEIFEKYAGYSPCYFIYNNRSKRYGSCISKEHFEEMFEVKTVTRSQECEKRKKQLKRIVDYLTASGLWSNIKQEAENLLTIEENDWYKIIEISKANTNNKDYGIFIKKYPFLFNDLGHLVLSDWEYDIPKIKTMNFGKYLTENERYKIKKALEENKDYSTFAYTSYDVSFNLRSDIKQAWYSEEYKGCGNGHYYLALDNIHALFLEDD